MNNKIKKNLYCNNCNKYNHEYKDCYMPITSYGIILIDIDDDIIKNILIKNTNILTNNNNIIINEDMKCDFKIAKITDFKCCYEIFKFLLVQRKHTLGFIEFMRGRYNIENIDGISHLFKQMTPYEINKIKTEPFENLWIYLWGKEKNIYHDNEYDKAYDIYLKLVNEKINMNLEYYLTHIKPLYLQPEWGFPKGRRNKYEDNKTCAIREFKEETNLKDSDFIILNSVEPITEDLIGTNGIKYRHIYYIGINLNNNIKFDISKNNEIGNIGFFNYNESLNNIRPYHLDKKKILTNIFSFLTKLSLN